MKFKSWNFTCARKEEEKKENMLFHERVHKITRDSRQLPEKLEKDYAKHS